MRRLLLLVGLCALLCSAGLLAGHWAVRSPQQMKALLSGSYGAVPEAFGRCVQRLHHEPALSAEEGAPPAWGSSAAQLGKGLAVEVACAGAAVSREVRVWAGNAQPYMSGLMMPAAGRVAAVSQHVGDAVAKQGPACAAAAERITMQAGARVAAWARQQPVQGGSTQHELYHGWLQHGAATPALAALHRSASERLHAAAAWAAGNGLAGHWYTARRRSCAAGERLRLGLHAGWQPAGAALRAAHALLRDSALAVLPGEEHAALQAASSSSQESTGALRRLMTVWKGMQASVIRLLGWAGSQDGAAGEGDALESDAAEAEEAVPAQTHVLRWPMPAADSGNAGTDTESSAHGGGLPKEAHLLEEASVAEPDMADSLEELAAPASWAEKGV